MPRERGQLPKAYLRIDPNLDSTHPAPGDMVVLICAANRQPRRGRFKSPDIARKALGAGLLRRCLARGDVVADGDGLYVDGWDEWQEGDMTVGERMGRLREKRRNKVTNGAVTLPSHHRNSPSEASRRLGVYEELNETLRDGTGTRTLRPVEPTE
jgi:hypothetical protein